MKLAIEDSKFYSIHLNDKQITIIILYMCANSSIINCQQVTLRESYVPLWSRPHAHKKMKIQQKLLL